MTTPSSTTCTYSLDGDVAVITLDDGKANVLDHGVLASFHHALDEAEHQARAVLICGREGYLSGGFDLAEMTAGPDRARDLVVAGARLHTRLHTFPRPVVVAVTGHAIAAGAILLLVTDWNVGERGPYRIGLPETTIGMPLPHFAVAYARARLSPSHFGPATNLGVVYDPAGALEAGYLHQLVDPGEARAVALAEARRLAGAIHPHAFARTRERTNRPLAESVLAVLEQDVTALTTGGP